MRRGDDQIEEDICARMTGGARLDTGDVAVGTAGAEGGVSER